MVSKLVVDFGQIDWNRITYEVHQWEMESWTMFVFEWVDRSGKCCLNQKGRRRYPQLRWMAHSSRMSTEQPLWCVGVCRYLKRCRGLSVNLYEKVPQWEKDERVYWRIGSSKTEECKLFIINWLELMYNLHEKIPAPFKGIRRLLELVEGIRRHFLVVLAPYSLLGKALWSLRSSPQP